MMPLLEKSKKSVKGKAAIQMKNKFRNIQMNIKAVTSFKLSFIPIMEYLNSWYQESWIDIPLRGI